MTSVNTNYSRVTRQQALTNTTLWMTICSSRKPKSIRGTTKSTTGMSQARHTELLSITAIIDIQMNLNEWIKSLSRVFSAYKSSYWTIPSKKGRVVKPPPLPPPAEPTPKTETTDEETTGEQPDWSRGAGGQFHSCRTRQADLAFTLEVLAWPL